MAYTDGIKTFWSLLKRAHMGTFHKLPPKHLNRYVQEFVGRPNLRELDIINQMHVVVVRFRGCTLTCQGLISDNGCQLGSRS